jgi:hypothetical protein
VPGGEEVAADGFGEVLYYFEWWDCPRLGAASVAGQPMMFDSPFDEDIDDYAREFRLWPISDHELAEDLAVWRAFALARPLRFGPTSPPVVREDACCAHVPKARTPGSPR